MKFLLAAVAVVAVTLGVASAAKAADVKAGGPVAQALIGMENDWAKSSKAGDGEAIGKMLAESFMSLDSDGSVHDKSDVVARTKKAKWEVNELSDMKVMEHGTTAIVTGTWTGKGTDGGGKAVDTKEHWMDTWIKGAGGKWHCVASAAAMVK